MVLTVSTPVSLFWGPTKLQVFGTTSEILGGWCLDVMYGIQKELLSLSYHARPKKAMWWCCLSFCVSSYGCFHKRIRIQPCDGPACRFVFSNKNPKWQATPSHGCVSKGVVHHVCYPVCVSSTPYICAYISIPNLWHHVTIYSNIENTWPDLPQ